MTRIDRFTVKAIASISFKFVAACFLSTLATMAAAANPSAQLSEVPANVRKVLNRYCADCHGAKKQKGKVRFDTLTSLAADQRTELLSATQEMVHFEEMPPEDKPQPTKAEFKVLMNWLSQQLGAAGDANLKDKMRYPHYGNVLDHDLLFSGAIDEPAATPARRWLVSPQIFKQRVMDVFELDTRERKHFETREFYGVTNPFVLPADAGVRDYDIGQLNGGHLLVMLSNAKWIAGKQIFAARHHGKNHRNIKHENPKDKWYPRQFGPESFRALIKLQEDSSSPKKASDEQLTAAINTQFGLALRREPKKAELTRYLKLMRSMADKAGPVEALRQLCVAVLLESEFLYRIEFGGGKADQYDRKKLTPHEAAFAISYALGDRGPDSKLLEAATTGKLLSSADYQREVKRLLADQTYYRGQVDPSISGSHYRSNETAHPKIVRFFREFFGYPAASKVFKDSGRAEGRYRNPGRGTLASPGRLIYEADRIVTWHIENDQEVFENLLTSDQYFVYDGRSTEHGEETIEQWRVMWEKLKDTPWKTEPLKVLEENFEFIKSLKRVRIDKVTEHHAGSLLNHMHFFSDYFPKGITPFPRVPWSHGYQYHHSIFYSLPPTPQSGRYGHWKSTKYNSKAEDKTFWDYPLKQPFSIPNRKGILSHPAWLIAYSTNFHTDPIRRGRWIREKLLAGRVPDVPITVDAKVPDHPKQTFRERVERVTADEACWKCHKHMNPLGLPFEAFDDFGRYRTLERLEHPDNLIKRGNGKSTFDIYPTKAIEVTGALDGSGSASLDGKVKDPFDMIDRLAKSDRVRQSIIRHAFRFYLGRNETLADARTLLNADQAYLKSDGSFKAVIVSLLTSDSFMYRR